MKSKATPPQWLALEELFDNEGSITLGYVDPIPCAAVASDSHNMLAALKRKRGESLISLLTRLDAAVAQAEETGDFIDEINS